MLVLITGISGMAQYKKASFFTRNGKFYGFKAGLHVFGNGVTATPSISFVAGRDKGKKHIWHWWDIEYMASSKFSYSTTEYSDPSQKVDVKGKINGMLVARYNWSYYFGDNSNADIKGLPFAKIGIEVTLAGRANGTQTTDPPNADPRKIVYREGVNGGIDLGAGYSYHVNENMTLFGVAGYSWMLNEAENYEAFFPNPSHPYINVGIRFARKNDD